jgi:ABC-2 type transport system permease protein
MSAVPAEEPRRARHRSAEEWPPHPAAPPAAALPPAAPPAAALPPAVEPAAGPPAGAIRPAAAIGRWRSRVTHRALWAISDGWTIACRDFGHLRRSPGQFVVALIIPASMVVLFGYVFGSAIVVPGGGDYREYLMPGLFGMTTMTGILGTALTVASDSARGVMDRFRSMPIARSAVPVGRTLADIVTGIMSTVIMVGCGLAAGWRFHNGWIQALCAFALLVLLRFAVSWVGLYLGLIVKNEETAYQIVPLIFPLTTVSNTFVPTETMPDWLRVIAEWNPVSAVVAACRVLFGNPGVPVGDAPLPLRHPIAATLCWSIGLLCVFAPLAVRRFRASDR